VKEEMELFVMTAKKEICAQIMRGEFHYLRERLQILFNIYKIYNCKIFDDINMQYTINKKNSGN
jgi:hypothetical protein